VTAGEDSLLSITGASFTSSTTVRLLGYGYLTTTYINSTALTAVVTKLVPTGQYAIEINDPTHGTAIASAYLTISAAAVTVTSTPQPTALPGQPTLVVSSFSASPASLYPGQTTTLSLQVVNVGNREAEGISLALGSTTFTPANGQASVSVSDLDPGESATVSLAVTAPADAAEGPASIPLSLTSRDYLGGAYTDEAAVSVTILAETALEAQVIINGYRVTPASAFPGATVTLQVVLTNTGTATASQVLMSLDTGTQLLIPAGTGSSISAGDLAPGASVPLQVPYTIASDAAEGAQAQPFTITYSQEGEAQETTVTIALDVLAAPAEQSQVVLESYQIVPESAHPGDTVTLQATLANTGTGTASQVLVSLDTSTQILIPASAGGSIALGDLAPGARTPLEVQFIIASDVNTGVQAQPLTITYLQDGAVSETSANVSLNVLAALAAEPQLLLQAYRLSVDDALQPGQEFSYEMTLQNAGSASAANVLLTFGESISKSSDNEISTSSSSTFSPLGAGSTVLLGEIAAGQSLSVSQSFIVSNDVTSGIYTLPVALEYLLPDGTSSQQTLNATVLVVVPPRLRLVETGTRDAPLTAGEDATLTVRLSNLGDAEATLTTMHVTGENVSISEGAEILLDPLQADDYVSESITFQAAASGDYTLTVAVEYQDDLSRTQTMTTTFTGTAEDAQTRERPTNTQREAPQPPETEDLAGRLLLGFLGFGG
jgi:hypothetical protein